MFNGLQDNTHKKLFFPQRETNNQKKNQHADQNQTEKSLGHEKPKKKEKR
jgi:hypothetical protein